MISRGPSKRAEIVTLLVTIFGSCCGSTAQSEPVIGQFELKTLDSDPGAFEFQSQNAWSWGQPTRQVANDGTNQLVFDENAVIRQRHALEIEAGITSRLKMRVGIEFEKERFEDPETLESAGAYDNPSDLAGARAGGPHVQREERLRHPPQELAGAQGVRFDRRTLAAGRRNACGSAKFEAGVIALRRFVCRA